MHPNSVIAVAAGKTSALTDKFGVMTLSETGGNDEFDLGLQLQSICEKRKGAILAGHGVINWANDNKSVMTSLDIIEKAARVILKHDKGENTFGVVRSNNARC
ncbi:hypothetical protein RS130_00755 [Paraglaciecola aquimarina]|uniref:Uncharacterized protein n=1 Tax=Paraglaciecola aquimarina TaxID=1235557 RepID=A0ABU3SRM2_9ALTE|nr:hypothetical protein [Paraglaciecola aquimarina]MDU0352641.1 hypothetical protein [Paraglaciecola aquimarina]